jgi:hypothetical protein
MQRVAIALLALLILLPSRGIAQPVDWKMFGTHTLPDGEATCFYDAAGVTRPGGLVRVWTKCLLDKEISSLDFEHAFGGKIVKAAKRKANDRYLPPITIVEQDDNLDNALVIIVEEQIANMGNILPSARIFYEINCSEKMSRSLSTYVVDHGKKTSINQPTGWSHIAPESNGSRLFRMLCPS